MKLDSLEKHAFSFPVSTSASNMKHRGYVEEARQYWADLEI